MQAVSAFAPFVAFFVAYKLGGLYVATGVLMAGMLLLLAFDWLRTRRIPQMHAFTTALVLAFGGMTLLLHDRRYIQWKVTIFFWAMSLLFLGSFWIGARTLAERMLAPAFEAQMRLTDALWRRLNGAWAAFCALLGGLNLLVMSYASEQAWVYFKFIGTTALTFAFVLVQVLWVSARAEPVRTEG
jgi:intracellular septation protein